MNIILGGQNTERLFLKDDKKNRVLKTNIPGIDMENVKIRHFARYYLVAGFCRPNFNVLDFPCGSGYAVEILKKSKIKYLGLDHESLVVEYAKKNYGQKNFLFAVNDLTNPKLKKNFFDLIACIEGLEHIGQKYQFPLIQAFYEALKPNGILIISSPENSNKKSGPSIHNKDHLWELTKKDFLNLLYKTFSKNKVEFFHTRDKLTTGVTVNCLYGVCHK